MKMKLFVSKIHPDFQVKQYDQQPDGTQQPIAGDPVYLIEFEPVLLTLKEYKQVITKSKDHVIEVSLED